MTGDVHIPLLIWWGIEAKAESDREAVLAIFDEPAFWQRPLVRKFLVTRILKRYAAAGGRTNLMSCVRLFRQSPDASRRGSSSRVRRGLARPTAGGLAAGTRRDFGQSRGRLAAFGRRQGRADAVARLRIAADPKASIKERLQLIEIFGEVRQPSSVSVLLSLAEHDSDPRIKTAALVALCLYDDRQIGTRIVCIYPHLADDPQARPNAAYDAQGLVARNCSRRRCRANRPAAAQIRSRSQDDRPSRSEGRSLIARHFPHVKGATTAEMQAQIARLSTVLKRRRRSVQGKTALYKFVRQVPSSLR